MRDGDAPSAWRRVVRCVCCRALPRTSYCVVIPDEAVERVGFNVVVTCQSHYCRRRAERGEVQP